MFYLWPDVHCQSPNIHMGTASQAVVAGSPAGSRLQFQVIFPKMAVVLVGMDPKTTKWTNSQAKMTRICR
jgi:hypothetical protein